MPKKAIRRKKWAVCRKKRRGVGRNGDIWGMKNGIMRLSLRAWHVKVFLWLWVVFYPLAEDMIRGGVIEWSEVFGRWILILPFLVLFLLFDLLIVPRLIERKHVGLYVGMTFTMLTAFVAFRYFQTSGRFDRMMPDPPAETMSAPEELGPEPDENLFRHAMPDRAEPRHRRKPRHGPEVHGPLVGAKPVVPYVMDGVIAFLMLGFDLTVALFFQMRKEREKMSEMEKANLQNEIRYLRAQLEPHFLMNMLNNIHGMIEVDPAKAQEMVINFSKLMRYALYDAGGQVVPLSHEATFVDNYIAIMRQRFSNRKVGISISMPEFIPDRLMVPPMLFIVFIENAFKHGVSYRQESFVEVSLTVMSDGRVRFTCANSVVAGRASGAETGRGIGLQNVRKRLSLLFGTDYDLQISEDLVTYRVSLEIPTSTNEKSPLHSC